MVVNIESTYRVESGYHSMPCIPSRCVCIYHGSFRPYPAPCFRVQIHASKNAVGSTVNNIAANMRYNVADARHQFTMALRTTAITVADVCGMFEFTANHVFANTCSQLEATARNVTDDVLCRVLLATGLVSLMIIAACGGWEIIKKVIVHEVRSLKHHVRVADQA